MLKHFDGQFNYEQMVQQKFECTELSRDHLPEFTKFGLSNHYCLEEVLSKSNYFRNYNKCAIMCGTKMTTKVHRPYLQSHEMT